MIEECLRCVFKGNMYFDDIQLPLWADQFICYQAAFYAQVVVMLWFVSWELDCTPVPLCFSKSELQNPNRQTSQDL